MVTSYHNHNKSLNRPLPIIDYICILAEGSKYIILLPKPPRLHRLKVPTTWGSLRTYSKILQMIIRKSPLPSALTDVWYCLDYVLHPNPLAKN